VVYHLIQYVILACMRADVHFTIWMWLFALFAN